MGLSQDGRGIGWRDYFLPHKFIERSFECWATSTKQLQNTERGHQAPRKAAHSLWKKVRQNIKDKKTKQLGMETHPGEGVKKEGKFPNSRKPSHRWVFTEFWNLKGQHNREGEKYLQNMNLTTTPRGEVAHMITSATSKQGLDRVARATYLG